MLNLTDTLTLVITACFLLFVLSYYVLLFIPRRLPPREKRYRSVSVIIPAHNEEERIETCVRRILDEPFDGTKEVFVLDDGSRDKTATVARAIPGITFISKAHTGKADTINLALKKATGDAIVIVDGDSYTEHGSLQRMVDAVGLEGVGAATCAVKVVNRKTVLGVWLHLEQLYNSLMRRLFCKLNMNAVTPGPLSAFRADALRSIDGFSTDGLSEDADVTIRMVHAGHRVVFVDGAASGTIMPVTLKGFFRQRMRFIRGMVHLLKKHLRLSTLLLDIYTLPLLFFTYVQAVVMGSITIWRIAHDYYIYFAAKGTYIGWPVLEFFFNWLSLVGFARWAYSIAAGLEPLSIVAGLGIATTILSYPLYIYAALKFDRRLDLWHLVGIMFMFPYFLLLMVCAIIGLPELFRKEQYNRWTK